MAAAEHDETVQMIKINISFCMHFIAERKQCYERHSLGNGNKIYIYILVTGLPRAKHSYIQYIQK